MRTINTPLLLAPFIALLLVNAGCGGGNSSKASSQIAARVNGDEISVHQINLLLSQQSSSSPEQASKATPQMLERLIDQQLLVQKAIKTKLDRDPQIMQRIEAAKNQILAQTYLERMSATSDKASAEDVRKFYKENPALFAERRIYRFEEIVVQSSDDKASQVEQLVKKSKSIVEVANSLKAQGIPFTGNSAVRAAEQLPMEVLPQLSAMKDGELLPLKGSTGLTILQLSASQAAPIEDQQASQFIQTYLLNRKRKEIAGAEMAQLRAAAKVEYVGQFEKTKPTSGPAVPPTSAPSPGKAPTAESNDRAPDDKSTPGQR